MTQQDYFGGPERIAIFEPAGRPISRRIPADLLGDSLN